MRMRNRPIALAALALGLAAFALDAQACTTETSIARGRYLVAITGCNDCHTPGWGESGATVPEAKRLVGDRLGWSGPWGTTYASNLRLVAQRMSESQWLKMAKTQKFRPPMPWFSLHAMDEADLRAVYRYIQSLGAAGEAAPAYVPPGQKPGGPAVEFPQ
jgi:mono/diheme cytochrome c family protein